MEPLHTYIHCIVLRIFHKKIGINDDILMAREALIRYALYVNIKAKFSRIQVLRTSKNKKIEIENNISVKYKKTALKK